MSIKRLSINHPKYPAQLKEISQPPKILYVSGNMDVLAWDMVAIIGSRKPTSYGKKATEYISEGVARAGVPIVSGLAYGIDALAHKTALACETPTIAVLGGGIDETSFYPKAHIGLGKHIVKAGGTVLSEFPSGTEPRPYHFPQRNRIIAGISAGVVIIQAADRSGALSTANHALDENRDVFIVPGSIFSPLSKGVHKLLKQGATPVESGQEILETLSFVYQSKQKELFSGDGFRVREAVKERPKSIHTLANELNLPLTKLLGLLTQLELDGQIHKLSGQLYATNEQTRYR